MKCQSGSVGPLRPTPCSWMALAPPIQETGERSERMEKGVERGLLLLSFRCCYWRNLKLVGEFDDAVRVARRDGVT